MQFRKDTDGGANCTLPQRHSQKHVSRERKLHPKRCASRISRLTSALYEARVEPTTTQFLVRLLCSFGIKTDVCSTSTNSKPVHSIHTTTDHKKLTSEQLARNHTAHCIFQLHYCLKSDRTGRGLCLEDANSLVNEFTPLLRGRCKFLSQLQT